MTSHPAKPDSKNNFMTTVHLHQKPRKISHLFISLITFIFLIIFINIFPPENFWPLFIFSLLFFIFTFYLCSYVFKRLRKSLLYASALTLFIILRLLGLNHWIYPLLILLTTVAFEFYLHNNH